MSGKRGLLCMTVVVFLSAGLASADVLGTVDVITAVNRHDGTSGDRDWIGAFNGDTDPLGPVWLFGDADYAEEPAYMQDDYAFSDRTYPYYNTPAHMIGSEYIPTFNTDKGGTGSATASYDVTIAETATIYVGIDARLSDRQARADTITSAFAPAGTFQLVPETSLTIREASDGSKDRTIELYAAELDAGTYTFGPNPGDKNHYGIGVLQTPPPVTHAPIAFTYSTVNGKGTGTISGTLDTTLVGGTDNAVLFTAEMPAPTIVDPNAELTPAGDVGTIKEATGDHNDQGRTVGIDWAVGPQRAPQSVWLRGTDDQGQPWAVKVPLIFGPSGDPGYDNPGEDPLSSYDPVEGPDYVYQWTMEISDEGIDPEDANSLGSGGNPRMAVYIAVGREEPNGLCHRFTQIEREFVGGPDAYTNTDATSSAVKWSKFAAYQPLGIYYGWRDRADIGGGSFQVDSIEFSGNLRVDLESIIPEPGTLLLLGVGGCLPLLRRRRR